MAGDILGGGVIVAIAAALWLAYLLPTWSRRRQYLATERNAVRLQQTLRILAETSEVPSEIRVEANARDIAAQQRLLQLAEEKARAERQVVEAQIMHEKRIAEAARAAQLRRMTPVGRSRASRLKRARATTSLFTLIGLVIAVVGLVQVATGVGAALLVVGVLGAGGGVMLLGRLAKAGRTLAAATAPVQASARIAHPFEPVQFEEPAAVRATWTPTPLPKPLYQSPGTTAASAMASAAAAAKLKRAAQQAALEERAAALRAESAPIPLTIAALAPIPTPAVPSRFASMGIVGDMEPGMSDLDAVLRRRRVG